WVGSRTNFKLRTANTPWWRAVEVDGLEAKLATKPGLAVYGEVYGEVQDLRYGVAGVRFVAFDAMNVADRRYLDRDDFVAGMTALGIPVVPLLYRGPLSGLDLALANGKTVLGNGACVREGFVVKPVRERFHESVGRVVLKLVGEDYHLR